MRKIVEKEASQRMTESIFKGLRTTMKTLRVLRKREKTTLAFKSIIKALLIQRRQA